MAACTFDQSLRFEQLNGNYEQAQSMLEQRYQSLMAEQHRDTKQVVKVLNQMTENLFVLNRLAQAEHCAEEVYRLLGEVPTVTAFDRISQLHKLGQLRELQGKHFEAAQNYSQELEETEARLGRPTPGTLLPAQSLGRAHEQLSDWQKSSELYGETLTTIHSVFPPPHIATSSEHVSLARVALKRGDLAAAEQHYLLARHLLAQNPVVNASQLLDIDRALSAVKRRQALAQSQLMPPY